MKTSSLTGAELDKWIAKIETIEVQFLTGVLQAMHHAYGLGEYSPSTNWSQGGPLIEKYMLDLAPLFDNNGKISDWIVSCYSKSGTKDHMRGEWAVQTGSTPLIAAMRAIVASVYGESVDE